MAQLGVGSDVDGLGSGETRADDPNPEPDEYRSRNAKGHGKLISPSVPFRERIQLPDASQQGQSGTGQSDLGSQAGSTLSGHADQQDLGELGGEVDQPGSFAGGVSGRQKPTEGEGFILKAGTGGVDDPAEYRNRAQMQTKQAGFQQLP